VLDERQLQAADAVLRQAVHQLAVLPLLARRDDAWGRGAHGDCGARRGGRWVQARSAGSGSAAGARVGACLALSPFPPRAAAPGISARGRTCARAPRRAALSPPLRRRGRAAARPARAQALHGETSALLRVRRRGNAPNERGASAVRDGQLDTRRSAAGSRSLKVYSALNASGMAGPRRGRRDGGAPGETRLSSPQNMPYVAPHTVNQSSLPYRHDSAAAVLVAAPPSARVPSARGLAPAPTTPPRHSAASALAAASHAPSAASSAHPRRLRMKPAAVEGRGGSSGAGTRRRSKRFDFLRGGARCPARPSPRPRPLPPPHRRAAARAPR
jgi:hypothetical protein